MKFNRRARAGDHDQTNLRPIIVLPRPLQPRFSPAFGHHWLETAASRYVIFRILENPFETRARRWRQRTTIIYSSDKSMIVCNNVITYNGDPGSKRINFVGGTFSVFRGIPPLFLNRIPEQLFYWKHTELLLYRMDNDENFGFDVLICPFRSTTLK